MYGSMVQQNPMLNLSTEKLKGIMANTVHAPGWAIPICQTVLIVLWSLVADALIYRKKLSNPNLDLCSGLK